MCMCKLIIVSVALFYNQICLVVDCFRRYWITVLRKLATRWIVPMSTPGCRLHFLVAINSLIQTSSLLLWWVGIDRSIWGKSPSKKVLQYFTRLLAVGSRIPMSVNCYKILWIQKTVACFCCVENIRLIFHCLALYVAMAIENWRNSIPVW